ncbi:MAG TPA: TonB-dependent receptor [Candidatus Sulfotelmatobacter sp.]|nr:TonB-dependent receptor [Candidatus Sulfotelmatobacter sp.]
MHPKFFVLLLFSALCWAQRDTGSIVGSVKDPSGGVVIGAKVTVTDADRGTSFETTTNQTGEYVASPLHIGRYNVTAEKQGFKKALAGPVVVDVQARPEVNLTLQVGKVSETIVVTSEGPQLETETSDLGQVVNGHTAETLPLNGRNYAQLALLGTGVAPAEPGSREAGSFGFSASGARALQNNFLLDGVDNNSNLGDLLNESTYVIQPSVDAIGEFKVQTNAYSAEFGRGNGAIMNAVIKSGTNQFHGDVYEFLRNDKFDGRNAFDEFGRQPYKQNQFGATLGGPIIKNRTFFFGDYEGLRIRQATPLLNLIPTPQEISGDFTGKLTNQKAFAVDQNGIPTSNQALDCNGNPTFQGEIFNTRLTQNVPSSSPLASIDQDGFCGVPITSNGLPTGQLNKFPTTLIDPLAARLSKFYPQPNTTLGGSNFLVDPHRAETRNNFDVRIDHKIAKNDDFFGRFSYEDQPSNIPAPFNNVLDGGSFFDGIEDNSYRSLALSETHLFTPQLVNEFRIGYNRINSHRLQINFDKNVAGDPAFGINFPGVPFVAGTDNGGLPQITFGDGTVPIGSSTFLPSLEKQNSYVFTENLTWIKGRHSFKFGGEIRREQFTIFQPAESRGTLDFGSGFTDNPAAPSSGGEAFATFLLGISDGGAITNLHNVDYRRPIYSVYAQDDFRVTPRLTFNLGLRYELFTTVKEAHDQQATFDFNQQALIVPKGQKMQLTPTLAQSIPVLDTGSRGLISPDLNNFAPRIGLAYQITNKLVLRSGYGVFYGGQENGPFSNPSPGFNPPFFTIQSFNQPCGFTAANPTAGQTDCSIPNFNVLSQGFPLNSLSDPNTPQFFAFDPRFRRTPYTQQWNMGLEYQLPAQTILQISYAGSRGAKLFAFYDGNQAVPTADQTAPTAPRRPVHTCNTTLLPNCDPSVFDTNITTLRSNAFSRYNSLQARLQKRLGRGLEFEAAYTYAHALDDASSANLGSFASGDFRDQTKPQLEYGNADFDVRHRLTLSYSYELPFGKGKSFGGNASGFANQMIGGWQIAGITTASTGTYFTPTDIATNLANSGGGGDVANAARPNRVGDPNAKPCIAGTVFNTCAFATNTVFGTFGNAGRNIIRGPGYQNWDFSIFKNFPITEQRRFEFRAEFFNLWNHVNPQLFPPQFNFDNPATDHGQDVGPHQNKCPGTIDNLNSNCAWGFVQSARDPRFIQFAMKFYF